jgi:hypothetical protein
VPTGCPKSTELLPNAPYFGGRIEGEIPGLPNVSGLFSGRAVLAPEASALSTELRGLEARVYGLLMGGPFSWASR